MHVCLSQSRLPQTDPSPSICSALSKLPTNSSVHFVGFGRTLSVCAFAVAAQKVNVVVFDPSNASLTRLRFNAKMNPGLTYFYVFAYLKSSRFSSTESPLVPRKERLCLFETKPWTPHSRSQLKEACVHFASACNLIEPAQRPCEKRAGRTHTDR
jgi:hypothetical protein